MPPPPRYVFRTEPPSIWQMLRVGVSDTAAAIPAAILDGWAVQLPGPGAPLVVSSPELIHDVLGDRGERFTRDRFMRRLLRRAWGQGLAAAEGAAWKRQRRAAAPAFRPQAVADNCARFAATAGAIIPRLPRGTEIALPALAAQIIAGIVFSVLVAADDTVDTEAVARDMPEYIRTIGRFSALDLLPLPEALLDRLRGIPSDPRVRRVGKLAHMLADARSVPGARADLIALLEGAGPIEDNIRGLFPAAMETTAAGVSWALYLLALHPEWQARVATEARANGGDWRPDALPIARRVVQEALRLYPPAPLMVRAAAVDGELGGFPVRRGQGVMLAIYAMHRHRQVWNNPDDFDPDRFLTNPNPRGYLPFGSGPRMCIAAQFALAEITVIVARLLSELELRTGPEVPQLSLQITTHAISPLMVTMHDRAVS